jgi:hypothetical protein
MVGKLGTVYHAIEAGGLGEVVLTVSGSTQTYVATSAADIARGDNILVTGRTDDGSLIVDKWFPPPNAPAFQQNQ